MERNFYIGELDKFEIDEELEKDFLNYLEEKEKENEYFRRNFKS